LEKKSLFLIYPCPAKILKLALPAPTLLYTIGHSNMEIFDWSAAGCEYFLIVPHSITKTCN
jgi:hypothetical protein